MGVVGADGRKNRSGGRQSAHPTRSGHQSVWMNVEVGQARPTREARVESALGLRRPAHGGRIVRGRAGWWLFGEHAGRSYSGHPSLHPRGLATAVPLVDSDPPFRLGMAVITVETAFRMWGVLRPPNPPTSIRRVRTRRWPSLLTARTS